MMEMKACHQTLAAARMRRMRQRQGRGAFLVTLELEPDDLKALRVTSPDHAGQAIFRLIDRLKAARCPPALLQILPRRVPRSGPAVGSMAMSVSPVGYTATSRCS